MMSRLVKTLMIAGLMLLLASASALAETPASASAVSQEVANQTDAPARMISDDGLTKSHDPISLGKAYTMSRGPGVLIGTSWYDMQHNGSMGRMVDWGHSSDSGLIVHFTWTKMATSTYVNRKYGYNAYRAGSGTLLGEVGVQADGEYGGFVGIDVADDNRAAICGHNNDNSGDGSQSHAYFQDVQGGAAFTTDSRFPFGAVYGTVIWPKFRLHEAPGHDPVLHVFAQESAPGAGDPQAIYYFRQSPAGPGGTWDYPAYVVDTVFDLAQDVACSNIDGKVALVWNANRPNPGDCDTCSSNEGQLEQQVDNDLYYQLSYDYGATFQPRVNLTKNIDGVEGHRPYADLSALITSDNDLHIAWNERYWPADANSGGDAYQIRCVMSHWGENLGFDAEGRGNKVEAVNLMWDQTVCNGGTWQLNGSKMSLSECNGKLYYLYVQFNDIPAGVSDDCSARASSDFKGAANGELYLSVSSDLGLTWDAARNLTNTYTPGCLPGECASESWPSMARFGTNHSGDLTGSVIVDPSGGYDGDYFLDVQYIDDPDAGTYLQEEGTQQEVGVRWFRLPCVEPFFSTTMFTSWQSIGDPAFTPHGQPLDTPLVLTNDGNADLNFVTTIEEETGPTGWLTVSAELASGSVAPDSKASLEGVVTLNTTGLVNTPGSPVELTGRLIIISNSVSSPDTLEISIWVDDDTDSDGLRDALDNCPEVSNAGQSDVDGDDVGDVCDNCPDDYNPGQEDFDQDGIGDVCEPTCCMPPMRGNINNDPGDELDIADLVYMVDYMFNQGPAPTCWDEAELAAPLGDEALSVSDLVYLVDYMFTGGPPPIACP